MASCVVSAIARCIASYDQSKARPRRQVRGQYKGQLWSFFSRQGRGTGQQQFDCQSRFEIFRLVSAGVYTDAIRARCICIQLCMQLVTSQ